MTLDPIWVYLAGNYELYSTGTIDCSGLQTTCTTLYILYCDLQEDTHDCNNIKIIVARLFV